MRLTGLLLVGVLVFEAAGQAGTPGEVAPGPRIPFTRFELANGLVVYVVEDHSAPMVYEVLWVRVGSKDERPNRTGFAHLFEHLMFKGSAHLPDGRMDSLLEAAGGFSNAATSADYTLYQNVAASNFLEQVLWIEADRFAGLIEALDQRKLDNQRAVVLNERRQSYENQPYGMAWLLIDANLWPKDFGYHWPTIGYAQDLRAATLDDVSSFFRAYYVPNNATMVIAGDVDPARVKQLVQTYFAWIPRAASPARPRYQQPAPIVKPISVDATDDVQVPRAYVVWRGAPAYDVDEPALGLAAAILGEGKSSRLYKRLVYEQKIAQNVSVGSDGDELAGAFFVVATAKPGVEASRLVDVVMREVEKLARVPPEPRELERAINARESTFLHELEPVMERAMKIAEYDVMAGDAGYFDKDLARFRTVTVEQVRAAVSKYLAPSMRLTLTIKPGPKNVDAKSTRITEEKSR